MGLGKTVQMIATMAMNMPKIEDDCRTTLIVVPAALLQQVHGSSTNQVLRAEVNF